MTRAPANLLAVRSLLLAHLDMDPDVTRAADLEPAEVGIVGDASHWGGYHCGSDRVTFRDYSVAESSRDSGGLTDAASALDAGPFSVTVRGQAHNLRTFSTWCAGECAKGAPDTRDIREIIYSPDGEVVHRWDRLKRRTTGDDSHLSHTHFSFFRDAIKAGRDQTPLFRRYLTTIGLLEDEVTEAELITAFRKAITTDPAIQKVLQVAPWAFKPADHGGETTAHAILLNGVPACLEAVRALAVDGADEPAIIQGVLAGLTPEKIAAAIPSTMAADVAQELARRMES